MPIIYVGLDVHKETIALALAEAGKRSEVREQDREYSRGGDSARCEAGPRRARTAVLL